MNRRHGRCGRLPIILTVGFRRCWTCPSYRKDSDISIKHTIDKQVDASGGCVEACGSPLVGVICASGRAASCGSVKSFAKMRHVSCEEKRSRSIDQGLSSVAEKRDNAIIVK
ncbi:hypothetical protein AVEN_9981-1 [Araneus ventricosus]|uniref:Uncharacterized protein n=1 Tax=Araneus ventricosus TaxID=182803 RepID=A0A4Y2F8Y5_ARAVE|nr:hypothetical protein AVEN_9981-1 [Araneus ventricosus]